MPLNTFEEIRWAYIAAFNAGDSVAVAELFTEDCVIVPPAQSASEGKASIVAHYVPICTALKAVLGIHADEEVILGDWGYGRGTWKASFMSEPGGKAVEVEGSYLNILKRETDGGWKSHRHFWNTLAPSLIPAT